MVIGLRYNNSEWNLNTDNTKIVATDVISINSYDVTSYLLSNANNIQCKMMQHSTTQNMMHESHRLQINIYIFNPFPVHKSLGLIWHQFRLLLLQQVQF